ncbi:MAG: hypothetical protein M1821_006944 [Bathelium mastoideum]|nr:MAG: hypothetical protein M1821_006944 [Bathelium mastoideum]
MLDLPIASVPIEEHNALVDKVKMLENELKMERQEREEEVKNLHKAIEGVYSNLTLLSNQTSARLLYMDDKVEGVLDQTHACHGGLKGLQEKVISIDDASMDLETRIDRLEHGQQTSKTTSPTSETISVLENPPFPEPSVTAVDDPAWSVKIMLMPQSSGHPFLTDSTEFRRCLSRNLLRELHLADDSSSAFVSAVDAAFLKLLRNRAWMPLITNPPDQLSSEVRRSLRGLPADKRSAHLWDRNFLQEYCLHYEKGLGQIIYIALQSGDLSWQDIKRLPLAHGFDPSCWDRVPESDNFNARIVHENDFFGIYMDDNYDLPPYTSRAPSNVGQSPLAAPPFGTLSRQAESSANGEPDAIEDEQAWKRVCRRSKSEGGPTASEGTPQRQMQQDVSGRSKRKIAVRTKTSQAYNRLADRKNLMQTLLHSHSGKDKEMEVPP